MSAKSRSKKSPTNRRQSLPLAVLFVGDTHVGGTTAVCPNGQSSVGSGLFEKWQQFVTDIKARARSYRIVLALGGDLVEGHHHNSLGSWGNYKQQRDAAIELLLPLATLAHDIIALPGTEAHAGDDGENDRQVAQELGARFVSQRHLLAIDGRRLDWAHHGISVSQNGWMDDGGMVQAIRRVEYVSLYQHIDPPDLIVSHHAHRSPKPINLRGIGAAVCGCWQLPTPHGNKIAPRSPVDIGVLWWDVSQQLPERWLYNEPQKYVELKK